MMKWIFLLGLCSMVGCATSTAPRKPSNQVSSAISVQGANAEAMESFLKAQNINEICDGRTCEIQAENISCSIERSLTDAECSWKIVKANSSKARVRNLTPKQSNQLYNMLKNLGAEEDCDGRTCSIELQSMGCLQERMVGLDCSLSK